MRNLDEVVNQLSFHPGTPETAPKFDALRSLVRDTATEAWDLIPDGPEKTLAYRALQQFLMLANLAVALTAPVQTAMVDRFKES